MKRRSFVKGTLAGMCLYGFSVKAEASSVSAERQVSIKTGLKAIDDELNGGFELGSLISVVGERNSGKTLFGCLLKKNNADLKCQFISGSRFPGCFSSSQFESQSHELDVITRMAKANDFIFYDEYENPDYISNSKNFANLMILRQLRSQHMQKVAFGENCSIFITSSTVSKPAINTSESTIMFSTATYVSNYIIASRVIEKEVEYEIIKNRFGRFAFDKISRKDAGTVLREIYGS